MKTRWTITIGREFCSGGAEIAHKVARKLEIPYYDKEILDQTVESTNFAEQVVAAHDEKPVGYFDMGGYQYGYRWYSDDPSLLLPLGMRVANAQFDVIRACAERGPCVIVGRCADYVLEDRERVLDVFIRAGMEFRIRRCMADYGLTEGDARKLIKKTDKIRSNYYRYYTQQTWGDAKNYDLVLDSDKLGIDGVVSAIVHQIELLEQK